MESLLEYLGYAFPHRQIFTHAMRQGVRVRTREQITLFIANLEALQTMTFKDVAVLSWHI
jgi:hypothetical protein